MNPAGQISGMIRELRPARQVLEEMVAGAAQILATGIPGRVAVAP